VLAARGGGDAEQAKQQVRRIDLGQVAVLASSCAWITAFLAFSVNLMNMLGSSLGVKR
jgi:hypothetical protein